jgi:nicotinamide-nucleotide amidase
VIAQVMGVEMRRDQAIADKIRNIFEARGRVMSANNLRQADIPVGASPIAQMPGTAPGLVCPVGDKVIYAVPGVPSEMREMVAGTILPDLRRRMGQTAVIRSRVLRTWGASESGVAEMVAGRVDELDKLGNPTIAFQASGIDGIKVRIVAKCDDEVAAKRVLDSEEALLRGLLGDLVFGIDEQSMEAVVLGELRRRSLTVAATETLTGGILSARMSALDPAMEVFRGAIVRPEAVPVGARAASPEQRTGTAAIEARERFGTEVGLAAVVPEATEGHGAGAVFLGVAIRDAQHIEKVMLTPDRKRMREFGVIGLLNQLRKKLLA